MEIRRRGTPHGAAFTVLAAIDRQRVGVNDGRALPVDVHVPWAITDQLRRRGVDVLTAHEDDTTELEDHELLARCHQLQRLLFTQDIRFKALAEDWQQRGEPFSGLLFGHQLGGTIGDYVRDLELIAKASEITDWVNAIAHLSFA